MDSIILLGQKNTLAEYMILSGVDNGPPMLDKDLLPPKWSKFVTNVKLVKDLPTTNFDQLHAYLKQNELHANEVRILRERNQDALAFMFPPSQYGSIHPTQHYSSTYPSQPQVNHSSFQSSYPYQSQMNHQTLSVSKITYPSPQVSTQPMTGSPLVDSAVASSRFLSTNNQLRTSLNLRNQGTIQDGKVTVQQVQGRQVQSYSGTGYKSNTNSSGGNNSSRHARVVKCYNYQEKAMLAEAQEARQILDEEELTFLTDPRVPDGQAVQTIPNNAAF
uniref:Integrase, catalytic region, zinc finger, CCHC-type, peptidase aspartic, catalytic n=1 Tax=Tanacetum cinerariifolium TaxID=118510 RepID=A0A6L2L8E1_TANCI|nr:hypothetical protein [Tanacetum cinerariifolium]